MIQSHPLVKTLTVFVFLGLIVVFIVYRSGIGKKQTMNDKIENLVQESLDMKVTEKVSSENSATVKQEIKSDVKLPTDYIMSSSKSMQITPVVIDFSNLLIYPQIDIVLAKQGQDKAEKDTTVKVDSLYQDRNGNSNSSK